MYVRKLGEREIEKRVSGMLWDNSLIMEDPATNSFWSHILGECVQGPGKGQPLEVLPSTLTDLGTWTRTHPATTAVNWPHRFMQNWKRDQYELIGWY